MPVKDIGVINKVYNQSDIDNAIKNGYQIAEKQYSLNIKDLKDKIKELTVSLESATNKIKLLESEISSIKNNIK